ncbi:MAG: hypothetical protein KatS3mg015_1449 [Fimbriimonadales bacterium]|nr:MAG: hypothetical protein KatS3mg015_1449 [Fimbriimonadales bacterium]
MSSGITGKDSLFYVGEVPWHGLGTPLPQLATAREALEASGLTWKVALREIRDEDYRRVENRRLLVREDTGDVLAVVTKRYEPLQNAEVFHFFDDVTADPNGPKYEVAGSLHGGRRVWLLARLPEVIQVVRGEEIKPYLLLVNGHDGRTAIRMFPTSVRVVCQNTLNWAIGEADENLIWRRAHTGTLDRRDVSNARKILGLASQQFKELEQLLKELTRVRVKPGDVDELLREVYRHDLSERRRQLVAELLESGPGSDNPAVRGTYYGLLNAITDMEDHYRFARPANRAGRLASSLFGQGAQRKKRALAWFQRKLGAR